jgi:hypothetical protein
MNHYDQFFAGTYFYLLKAEHAGVYEERDFFALSTILLLAVSQMLVLWTIGNIWFDMALMGSMAMSASVFFTALGLYWAFYLRNTRYVEVIRHFKERRRTVMWRAIAVNAAAVLTFFSHVAIMISRLP